MTENKVRWVYPRLQLAYLLQFAIWGSWSVALGGYLNLKMSGPHIGALYMAIPWGAIIAPMFIGPIADRFFSAQKVLGLLHLISGAALVACGLICAQAESRAAGGAVVVPFGSLMVLMLISGLCFMPSIPLINTVVFKHIPDSASAPKVFIFGTAGWIVVNLVVEVFAGGAGSPTFFFIGGGCGIFLGLYSLTLPDTPPKGAGGKMQIGKLFSFGGRISRQTFWFTSLGIIGISFLAQLIIGGSAGENESMSRVLYVSVLIPTCVLLLWASLATQVKRWHDRGKSGWMVLVNLIPIIGPVWALAELGFLRGTAGVNEYGPEPSPEAGALTMFKSRTFTIFVLCAFMVSIFGSNYFFPSVVAYLSEFGYPAPVALTTLNQFSELFFMAILPLCVARFGLKWVLVIGMSAWAVRYFIFPLEGFQFALIGLLCHGMAYAFLYVAAYMFGDRVAPAHLKASVQSLLAFLLLGIGQVLSGYLFGYQIDRNAPAITKTVVAQDGTAAKSLPAWNVPAMETSAWRYLDLAKSVKYLRGDKDVFSFGEHLGKYTKADGSIDLDKLPDAWQSGGVSYTKAELKATFDKIGARVTRDDYLKAQRHNWKGFFIPPAIFALVWVFLFIVFGKQPAEVPAEGDKK